MIYTIVSDNDTIQNAVFAANLAASRAKEGRKVLLIEANLHMHLLLWTLRRYRREATLNFPVLPLIDGGLYRALQEHRSSFPDIVINVGATNSSVLRTALIAAGVLIILIERPHMELKNQEALRKIADAVKLFNPLVQTYLLAAGAPKSISVQDYATAVNLAEKFPGGSVLAPPMSGSDNALQAFRRGLTVFEDVGDDEAGMRGMFRLFQQLSNGTAGKSLANQIG